MRWFRMYSDAIQDNKLRLLAFEDRWHFVAVLCMKASGLLDSSPSELRERRISVDLGLTLREADEVKRRLCEVGLIGTDWSPTAWDRRQYKHDDSSERVRKHREKKRETACNGYKTVAVTDTDTDTDTDKKSKGDEYAADFCFFWNSWPDGFGSKGSKKAAFAEWRKAKHRPDAESLIRSATAQAAEKAMKRRNGDFAENFKHVCRWIKGREWENEVTQVTRRAAV